MKIRVLNNLCLSIALLLPMAAIAQEIHINRIPAARHICWKRYKGNLGYHELPEKLPRLSEGAYNTVWLPSELEHYPNGERAGLNFYYGYKGESDTPRPAFLYLHGSGPRDMEWATGLQLCTQFVDSPSVYIIPQIPQEGEWYRWYLRGKQWAWNRFLRELLTRDDIDASRLYLFGISEGGYGSQRLASFYADYLAAAGPMAGGEPLKNAPVENLRNIAFSLRTGAEDKMFYRDILTGYTAAALDSIAALTPGAYRHWVELIPGRGHHIDYFPTPAYLRQFERDPLPTEFTWEDFEMDGQHRQGFYYLAVDRRPCDSLRTRYDVRVDDNNVHIDVKNVHYTTTEIDPRWGIEMKFNRTYDKATGGRMTVFLDEHLVDLSKQVSVFVNGKRLFKGKPKITEEALRRSIELWGDPLRLLPVAITLDY